VLLGKRLYLAVAGGVPTTSGSLARRLRAMDTGKGKVLWEHPLSPQSLPSPVPTAE